MKMDYVIRKIEKKDDLQVEHVIRTCLIEYGANHEGTAWCDPNLHQFSTIYTDNYNQYYVVEVNGEVLGGVGFGKLDANGICELQKMYFLKELRGHGIATKLLGIVLDEARKYYKQCYLETLPNMVEAQHFYEKNGFYRIDKPVVKTEHFACDVLYLKDL